MDVTEWPRSLGIEQYPPASKSLPRSDGSSNLEYRYVV
jgi:hypothetical protein